MFFFSINPNYISHSPFNFGYRIINFFIKFFIVLKKINSLKIIEYNLSKEIKKVKLIGYNFIAFKVEDLMNFEELIMIKYYLINKKKYKNFYDLGANIGLHSIIAKKLGFNVESYEPDKDHFKIMKENFNINFLSSKKIKSVNKAIYNKNTNLTFVKVKNNTTANHLKGFKKNLYGPTENYTVKAINLNKYLKKNSLIKMDIEGSENKVLKSIALNKWKSCDCLVSIHNAKVAKDIFNFFKNKNIYMFASKSNWNLVNKFQDIPTCHAEGLLFISSKKSMNWSNINSF